MRGRQTYLNGGVRIRSTETLGSISIPKLLEYLQLSCNTSSIDTVQT